MSIATVVTRGYGTGTVNDLPTRGYTIGSGGVADFYLTLAPRTTGLTLLARSTSLTLNDRTTDLTLATRSNG